MTERIDRGQPPYLQIAEDLRRRILSGELAPGDHLPSGREIARQWGCAYATATKVLTTLRKEGLAETYPGHATVVSNRQRHRHLGDRYKPPATLSASTPPTRGPRSASHASSRRPTQSRSLSASNPQPG